jgi:putative ABC transport system permease protein
VGILIGLAVALLAGRAMASLLFEVSATDPLIYGGVTGVLLVVALAASYLPARRAARVDPLTALRDG